MKTKEYNKGVSFLVPYARFSQLCRALSRVPGVVFLKRPKFFWSGEDIKAEFQFEGSNFSIEVDPWEAGLWVSAKDSKAHYPEMQNLRNAVEEYATPLGMIGSFFKRIFSKLLTHRPNKAPGN